MKARTDLAFRTAAILGSLVAVNLLGIGLFTRADLTHDHQFTLSTATRETLAHLKEPVTIRAWFTRDLPPPYSSTARYVSDMLEEYYAHGGGNLRWEMVDPASEETAEDKNKKKDTRRDFFGRELHQETSVEKELAEAGISPLQVRVNESDKVEVKRAYMGISLRYGDKKEVIPVVQETQGLEYDLTSLIRKLAREKVPKLGVLQGFGGPDLHKGLGRLMGLLGQTYQVAPLDLSGTPVIPPDMDGLLVIGPDQPVSEDAQRAIDDFVVSGHPAAFFLDKVHVDLSTGQSTEAAHGLAPLLESYGARIDPGLVVDAQCASISITEQRGNMRITQPVRFPYAPRSRNLDPRHPVTHGINEAVFAFMSPLSASVGMGSKVKWDVLAESSPQSGVANPPWNFDPRQQWTQDMVKDPGPKELLIALSGPIPSHFDPSKTAASSRVLAAGGSTFVTEKTNDPLVLNMVDWMLSDEALLAVRTRGLSTAPLKEIGDGPRIGVKLGNIMGLPLAFVIFGLVSWRVRESRRGRVKERLA